MKKNKRLAAGSVIIAIAALVAAAPRFIFPVDEIYGQFMQLPNGMTDFMHCHYTLRASYMNGAMIGLIGGGMLLNNRREAMRTLSVLLAGVAVLVVLTPTVIFPVCQNPDHHCNQGAVPLLVVLGIGAFMVSGWLAVSSRRPSVCRQMEKNDSSSALKAGKLPQM